MDEGVKMNKYTEAKIEEAKQVGKCPWCADGGVENYVFRYMNGYGEVKYPQESFWESQARWLDEGVITQERYDEIAEDGIYDKKLDKLFKLRDAFLTITNSGIFYKIPSDIENAYNAVETKIGEILREK